MYFWSCVVCALARLLSPGSNKIGVHFRLFTFKSFGFGEKLPSSGLLKRKLSLLFVSLLQVLSRKIGRDGDYVSSNRNFMNNKQSAESSNELISESHTRCAA